MSLVGSFIDKAADALHLPEVVGDAAKIGAGIFMRDPMLIMDGITDITPNVCDFLEDTLELDEGDSEWKKAANFLLDGARDGAETGAKVLDVIDGAGKKGGGPKLLLDLMLEGASGKKV